MLSTFRSGSPFTAQKPQELIHPTLYKHTGVVGVPTEVDSISFKTVDFATRLDSLDSMNYPVRSPYGTDHVSISYENWIKIKLKLNVDYLKYLRGTIIQFPCDFNDRCVAGQEYSMVKNPSIWLKFKCFTCFDIKYGFSKQYRLPINTESDVAVTNIRTIQNNEFSDEYSIEIPFESGIDIMLGDLESFESDFFVTQLFVYKGSEFQNSIMDLKFHYELS